MRIVVTGGAGFIGSHLVEALLLQGHKVEIVDNLWTGSTKNIYQAYQAAGGDAVMENLKFFEMNLQEFDGYKGVDMVFHQAALGSIPRSFERPLVTHQANVEAFFLMLNRARKAGVKRIVYASSSSVYGDSEVLPRKESDLSGRQLSVYSATKKINELYAEAFRISYGMEILGLRYFNVYGPRQSTQSDYAALIPKWAHLMTNRDQPETLEPVEIYGDGTQTRDFTYVKDVVRANLWAMEAHRDVLFQNPVINIGSGKSENINRVYELMAKMTGYKKGVAYRPERSCDRKHSLADLSTASRALVYEPIYSLEQGLQETLKDFL